MRAPGNGPFDPNAARRFSLRAAVLPLLERCFQAGGILGYHGIVETDVPSPEMHVSLGTLRVQLEYVRDHFNVIPLWDLVRRHRDGRPIDRCLAVTFDDAYLGVERLAAPLLARLDLPATVFVTVSAAESGAEFWWDRLEHVRRTSPHQLWPQVLNTLGIEHLPPSAEALGVVREYVLAHRAGNLPADILKMAEPQAELLRSMSFETLARLACDARFDFGCHTVTHPALPFLSGGEQHREMVHAQRRLEERLPRVVPIIAYPFGLYDRGTMNNAVRAGFRAGVTMQARVLARDDLAMALPRAGVSEHWSPAAISLRLNAGLRHLFRARAGTHPRLPADSAVRTAGSSGNLNRR